ncbi:tRNA-specific adenosine deaminase [Chromatiales bacterium (ex Bugula neritina AB1)]|nr:tRNA-specific adenosine deaminase [Chromatiales bacterium (ex Bugula neritina AB1)]
MSEKNARHLVKRLLDVIESDILPLTTAGVAAGNKIFGAALLHKNDLSTLLAETNNELENPLWHGEMHTLKRYYEMPASERPEPKDLIFLTTHEPCSLCLSAITWTGFDNFYYFFSHEDSRDAFSIPHDLKILKAVFNVEPGQYQKENEFWTSHSIRKLASEHCTGEHSCSDQVNRISQRYSQLSDGYQSNKDNNGIPLN